MKDVSRNRAHQLICPQHLAPGAADRILNHGEGCMKLMQYSADSRRYWPWLLGWNVSCLRDGEVEVI